MTEKKRTLPQNNSLHKYCEDLAVSLNEAGLDMKKTLKPEIEIPWTMENVKEHLFKPIMKAATGKESTADLTTEEMIKVYEVLNRFMGQKHGITTEWPSRR
jgi:hypothetical protein